MKTIKHLLFLCFLSVLVACSEDTFIPQSEISPNANGNSVDLISMVVPDIEMDDAATRSKLIDDGTGLKFAWQENDAIGIVPMSGNPLRFPINADNAGKSTAIFDGGGWALRTDMKYAAFFPINEKNQGTDIKHIVIDYAGQTQGNYMKYDFLATGAVKPSDGQVTFNMKRLSAILKISISMPAGSTSRYGTLIAPEESFGVKGVLDLSGNEPVYTPTGRTKFINTDLGIEKSSDIAWTYEVYMMIPPTNLSGKTLTFRLTSDAGYAYEAELQGKNFEAGKAYKLSGSARGATIKNLNLINAAQDAGQNPEVGTFSTNTDGTVNVNDNLDKIAKVVSIQVIYAEDPTICDEIGYFRNLEKLTCGNYLNTSENQMINSLDVSNNTKLTLLAFGCNKLTTIDLSKNTLLETLYCFTNSLASLDLSNNPELRALRCQSNLLTSLDLSNNPKLQEIRCGDNQMTSLDVSGCMTLTDLRCANNQLTSLDLSNCTSLNYLECPTNNLTSLDISNSTALKELRCNNNQFTSLDVSNNAKLELLDCGKNQLTSLDVSNNTALINLFCRYNQLTSLDVSNNTNLITILCDYNQITSINLTNNTELETLTMGGNKLTSLDVSSCSELYDLHCFGNQLTSLDVSNLTNLEDLYCFSNQLTSLDVSNNTELMILQCDGNKLTTLDVSNNTNLEELSCARNPFEELSINDMEKLVRLDISNCPSLKKLKCQSNHLSTLFVQNNPALELLWCQNNYLDELNLSGCTALKQLRSFKNMMSYLDISGCTSLYLYYPRLDSFCLVGDQYADENRNSYQEMTLKARSNDTTDLNTSNTSFYNEHVTVTKE